MNKVRVLIVDDDKNLSRLSAAILEKTRLYEVCVENHAQNALNVVRAYKPAAVLLDVDMPIKGGGDIAREIRADAKLHNLPILFISGLVSKKEAAKGELVRGGERFLSKPVEPEVLIRSVENLLRGSAAS